MYGERKYSLLKRSRCPKQIRQRLEDYARLQNYTDSVEKTMASKHILGAVLKD